MEAGVELRSAQLSGCLGSSMELAHTGIHYFDDPMAE